ncbi:MAG: helix-turn-helix transcriptional regulator [Clostridia bacterium]|jgi:putative transcriptional regulator|nr:helix-turn-helix transcriptional regulator [Clostridia bacterium]
MVQLRIKELLNEQKKTKYWFIKHMEGSYRSLSNMMDNKTTSIRFDTIDKLCDIFNCEVGEIIERKKNDE